MGGALAGLYGDCDRRGGRPLNLVTAGTDLHVLPRRSDFRHTVGLSTKPLPQRINMTTTTRRLSAAALGLALSTASLTGITMQSADAHTTGLHDNCTNFNKRYTNGVGTRNAVDKGGDSRKFLRNNRIYWRAENHNGDLDRDNDRIACEQS